MAIRDGGWTHSVSWRWTIPSIPCHASSILLDHICAIPGSAISKLPYDCASWGVGMSHKSQKNGFHVIPDTYMGELRRRGKDKASQNTKTYMRRMTTFTNRKREVRREVCKSVKQRCIK